jgi:hypothetical protein
MEVEIKYKKCTCCGMEFPATTEYWYKYKPGKYGLMAICKQCHKEKKRLYRQRPEVKEKRRLRYHSDDLFRNKCIDAIILWHKNNPEKRKDIKKKIVNELKSSYVADKMRRRVKDLTPEIIETKRLIIQLKRELKNNNVKIN